MDEPMFAIVQDLEARWRTLDPDETNLATQLLGDASQMILDELGSVEGVSERTLRRVVCAMVKRAMSVPVDFGVESLQGGTGPFQETIKFSNPLGDLYLTRQEKRALGIGRQRAFNVDLLADHEPPDPLGWLP